MIKIERIMENKNGRFMDIIFVPSKDCFLHVSPGNIDSMQCKAFKIFDDQGEKLFGLSSCFATPSQSLNDNHVGISSKFAEVIGLENVKSVLLSEIQSNIQTAKQAIFTATDSDYSIIIMNAAKVEYNLLDQVRIVGQRQNIIVWVSPRLSVTLTAEKLSPEVDTALLSNETEVHILPASDTKLVPSQSSQMTPKEVQRKQLIFRMQFSQQPFLNRLVAKIHPALRPNFLFATAKILGTERTVSLQLIEDPEVDPPIDFLSSMPVIHVDRRVFQPAGGVFEGCKVLLQPLEVVRNNEFIVHASEKVSVLKVKEELKQLAEKLNKELLVWNQMVLHVNEKLHLRFELKTAYTNLSSTSIESCNMAVVKETKTVEEPSAKINISSETNEEIFSSWHQLLEQLKLSLLTNMKTSLRLPLVILKGKTGCGVEKFLQHFIRLMTTTFKMHDLALDCKAFKGKTMDILKHKLTELFLEGAKHDPCIIVFENIDQFFPPPSSEAIETPDSSYRLGVLQIIWSLSQSFSSRHNCFVIATASTDQEIKIWEDKMTPYEVFQVPDLNQSDKVQALKQNLIRLNSSWTEELELNSGQIVEICTYQDICDIAGRAVFEKLKSCPQSSNCTVTKEDLTNARNYLTSQSLKEFNLLSIGDASAKKDSSECWSNVGGLSKVKEALTELIFWPFEYPHLFASNPLKLQKGALLYGMPGTGKTLVAVEIAKSSGMNLIHIKGPELLNKFIGASEEAVRNLFLKASVAKPCILFFDEIDSLAPRRGRDTTGVSDRVVNQLLTSLDGVDSPAEAGVWVLAASSRPDLIDRALLRPGRFDAMLYCNMPSEEERLEILTILASNLSFSKDVELAKLAEMTDGYCGADIQALLQTSQLAALEEFIDVFSEDSSKANCEDMCLEVNMSHVSEALAKTRPSLTAEEKARYEKIFQEYEQSMMPIGRNTRTQLKQRTVLA